MSEKTTKSTIQRKNTFSKYSLSHLTILDCTAPELIYIAARAGYDEVGPRFLNLGVQGESPIFPLEKDLIKATKKALEVTGIRLRNIELIRITDESDIKSFIPAMEVASELGAKHVIVSIWTDKKDEDFNVDIYTQICDLAKKYNLDIELEFPSFSTIKTLKDAAVIVEKANCPNGGILIDTLYLHLSRVDLNEIARLPTKWFKLLQISDILPGIPDSEADMRQIARSSRLYPGEGCIDFAQIIKQLPQTHYSIEIPNYSRVKELGYEEHARRALTRFKESIGL